MTAVIEATCIFMENKRIQEILYQDKNFSLLIHPLDEKDAEVITSVVLLSQENLKPFMDWAHREISIEQQRARIQASTDAFSKGTYYNFSVFDKETNDFLMSASLHAGRVPNKKALGIGYWTSSKYCNRGLATLLTKILIFTAFEHFNCDRVEIGCNKANGKSIRVIEKCGFIFECEAKNYFSEATSDLIQNGFYSERTGLLYALTKDDIKYLNWYQTIREGLTITVD